MNLLPPYKNQNRQDKLILPIHSVIQPYFYFSEVRISIPNSELSSSIVKKAIFIIVITITTHNSNTIILFMRVFIIPNWHLTSFAMHCHSYHNILCLTVRNFEFPCQWDQCLCKADQRKSFWPMFLMLYFLWQSR